MDAKEFRKHCMAFPGATEGLPFGEGTLVFKIAGKIYALVSLSKTPLNVNLKCDPDRAIMLRQRHTGVIPGYHMNKKHWNTVVQDQSVPDILLLDLLRHSHELVFNSLSKQKRNSILPL